MVAPRKVSDEEVVAIRTRYDNTNHRALAREFGISVSYVLAIAYYRNRKNVGPPPESVRYYISDGIGGRPKGIVGY